MGRLWAFAKEGTGDFKHYWESKEQWRGTLRKMLGERHPSDERAKRFVSRVINLTLRKREVEAVSGARKSFLKHFSPSDVFLSKKSIEFGARSARTLALKPEEKPSAALFFARTHEALDKIHDDPKALGDFKWMVDILHERQRPNMRLDLRKVYDLTVTHRVRAAARLLNMTSDEFHHYILTMRVRFPTGEVFLKPLAAWRIPKPMLGGKRTPKDNLRLVFGLCDVPEALWAGERALAARLRAGSPGP